MCDHLCDDPVLCSMIDRVRRQSIGDDGSRLRTLLIGSPQAVWGRILAMHRVNLTPVGEWSALIGIPNTSEVISIHTERGQRLPDIIDRAGR